ncbi:MAG: glycosyltransferase [Lachnospiraceae bacterium]|nr:glycosyltransferase [Lachnospiraceae bacterium]
MAPLVSIIVPVYNIKKYLRRCADSLIGQDYENLEILFIDDGSTDGSESILDEYQRQDPRVRVIHQENAGVSASRNRGLDLARGEYIQFADSDDWLPVDATRQLVSAAQEQSCDLVIADFYRVAGSRMSQKGDIDEDEVMTRMEFAAHMIENPADFYYGVLWNKLFRRSIIERYHLRMDDEISWCEDFLFNLEYIRYAESFYAIQTPVYYYFKRKNSLVSQGASLSNTIRMKITVFDYYSAFYRDVYEDSYEDVKGKVRYFLLSAARDGFVMPTLPVGRKKTDPELSEQTQKVLHEKGGLWADLYDSRRLLEEHLCPGEEEDPLTPEENALLLLFERVRRYEGQREIAEILGLTVSRTARALGRLKRGDYIEIRTDTDGVILVELLEKGQVYAEQAGGALKIFRAVCFRDLSDEDVKTFSALTDRMRGSVRGELTRKE